MEIPKELSYPVKRALGRLGIGDLTEKEMFLYLTDPRRSASFSPEIAERVVVLLRENGFLDDKRYLKNFVRVLDGKCFGPRRIRKELIKHHFPARYVDAVLSRNVDYEKRAFLYLTKKAGAESLSQTKEGRKKLVDALVRYGFDYGVSASAVAKFSGEWELSQ